MSSRFFLPVRRRASGCECGLAPGTPTVIVTGECYGIADNTALVTVDFARTIQSRIGENQGNLKRWYAAVSSRDSAKA